MVCGAALCPFPLLGEEALGEPSALLASSPNSHGLAVGSSVCGSPSPGRHRRCRTFLLGSTLGSTIPLDRVRLYSKTDHRNSLRNPPQTIIQLDSPMKKLAATGFSRLENDLVLCGTVSLWTATKSPTVRRGLIPSHIRWRDTLSTVSRTCAQASEPVHRRNRTLGQPSFRDESGATVRRIAAVCRATR